MNNPSPRIYRPCVGMMVLNKDGLVFVAQRSDMITQAWQMPQGGIDSGETPYEAALRELEEEIGTRDVELIAEAPEWFRYDLPEELLQKLWDGQYKGQEQKWFLFRLNGDDSSIDITKTNEFSAWKWAEINQLKQLVVPFKIDVYEKVIGAFEAYIAHHPSP